MTDRPTFAAPSDRDPGDFQRLSGGAPRVSSPKGDGKMVTYRRPSGFAVEPNTYNLQKWKERQLVIGLLTLLGDEVHSLDLDDRDSIDRLINDSYDASDTSLAADRGTHAHALTEHVDTTGQAPPLELITAGEVLGIPAELQHHIVEQWVGFRAELGLVAVHVEVHVVNDLHRCAGTVDRIDELTMDLPTEFGLLVQGDRIVGDIKTGSMSLNYDGSPRYWTKYGPQLALYAGSDPYDVDTDTRGQWDLPPRRDIALLYHYDLKAAIDGEPVEWQAIPVDLKRAGVGVVAAQAIHDYAKDRQVFGAPLDVPGRLEQQLGDSVRRQIADAESTASRAEETRAARRTQLLERYHRLADVDQQRYLALGVDANDLDAVERGLDRVDPFAQVTPPQPRRRTA